MKEEKKLAANSNNVYGIIEIYHRSNTYNASIYHHFFSPLVFQKFKYFTNLIKTLYLLRTVDFEIYNVEKKNAKLCKQFARVANIFIRVL